MGIGTKNWKTVFQGGKRREQPLYRHGRGKHRLRLSHRHGRENSGPQRAPGRGQIDIIACQEGTYLFVEVKRRSSGKYGAPIAAVTPAKARRILRAASLYLAMHGLSDQPVRFDVIELLPGTVRHIPGAFDGTYL